MTRRRGFTLIEILLALIIFSAVIVAIIEGITLQLRAQQVAEDTSRAVMLAESIMDQIRYEEFLSETEESGEFENANAGFSWEYQVAQADVENLWEVTVTVSWSDGAAERDHTLQTLMADR